MLMFDSPVIKGFTKGSLSLSINKYSLPLC